MSVEAKGETHYLLFVQQSAVICASESTGRTVFGGYGAACTAGRAKETTTIVKVKKEKSIID